MKNELYIEELKTSNYSKLLNFDHSLEIAITEKWTALLPIYNNRVIGYFSYIDDCSETGTCLLSPTEFYYKDYKNLLLPAISLSLDYLKNKKFKRINLICNNFNDDIKKLNNDNCSIELIDFIAYFDFKRNLKFQSSIKSKTIISKEKTDNNDEKIVITIKTLDDKNILIANEGMFNTVSIKSIMTNNDKIKMSLIKKLLKESYKLNYKKVLLASKGENITDDYKIAKNLGFKISSRKYKIIFK